MPSVERVLNWPPGITFCVCVCVCVCVWSLGIVFSRNPHFITRTFISLNICICTWPTGKICKGYLSKTWIQTLLIFKVMPFLVGLGFGFCGFRFQFPCMFDFSHLFFTFATYIIHFELFVNVCCWNYGCNILATRAFYDESSFFKKTWWI